MDIEILSFIKKFKSLYTKEIEESFLYGNCLYFAIILKLRFPDGEIMLMQIDNHFVFKLNNDLFDIRGNVSDICNVPDLISFSVLEKEDNLYYKRLLRDCFYKNN